MNWIYNKDIQVILAVKNYYDCKEFIPKDGNIIIKDEILESYIYMATFEDETLDEVLKLIKLSAPIEYKDLGRKRREDGTFEKRKIELYYKPSKIRALN